MAKGESHTLKLCAGEGLSYFPLINQHLLMGGQKKSPEMIRGVSIKLKEKMKISS